MHRLRTLLAVTVTAAVATVLPAGGAAAGYGHDVPLRVASYNIHAAAGEDNVFDLGRTAEAIRALHADVVGLEEVDVHFAARSDFVDEASALAERLHLHVFFAPIYDLPALHAGQPDRRYGLAILSRPRILAATNHEITRLSTQDPHPTPQPAPGFPEVVVEAHGVHVHVFATHLDFRADPSVRRLQVADTARILDATPGPKVLIGDLNATPDAAELAPLFEELSDTWRVVNGPAGGLSYPAVTPKERIDYVTVSAGIGVRRVTVPDTQASDHRPVVADLLVPRRHPHR